MDVSAAALVARRRNFVLEIASFHADAGGTAVLGPNGAGKTTLLLALQQLIACEGVVRRPSRSAAVFARPAVLRGSVLWNVSTIAAAALGITHEEAEARAARLLDDVGIEALRRRDARSISTGERQRLAIARALAVEPHALFLDEPFANVDADGRPQLRSVVRAYAERSGCALVLVTSSLADAAICANVIVLRAGRVSFSGARAELRSCGDPFARALLDEANAGGATYAS